MPNGFAAMWKNVNDVIFEGNGMLFKEQVGLNGEVFTPMDTRTKVPITRFRRC